MLARPSDVWQQAAGGKRSRYLETYRGRRIGNLDIRVRSLCKFERLPGRTGNIGWPGGGEYREAAGDLAVFAGTECSGCRHRSRYRCLVLAEGFAPPRLTQTYVAVASALHT
jgi:hypothetical protein